MNHPAVDQLERAAQALVAEDWLQGDVGVIGPRARRFEARRRRARVAVGLVAAAVVVLLATAALARPGRDRDPSVITAAQAQALNCTDALRAGTTGDGLVVTMAPSASTSDEASVVALLEGTVGVRDVQVHDRDEALRQLRDLVGPEADGIRREDVGSRVTAAGAPDDPAARQALDDRLRSAPGVVTTAIGAMCRIDDAEARALVEMFLRGRWSGGVDLIVFVDPLAGPDQQADVAAAVVADPSVRTVTGITPAAALDELRCLFAADPGALETIGTATLPQSYRLDLADEGRADALDRQLSARPGVAAVAHRPTFEALFASGTMPTETYGQLIGAVTDAQLACTAQGTPLK